MQKNAEGLIETQRIHSDLEYMQNIRHTLTYVTKAQTNVSRWHTWTYMICYMTEWGKLKLWFQIKQFLHNLWSRNLSIEQQKW